MDQMNFDRKLLGWQSWVGIIRESRVLQLCDFLSYHVLDMERYAEKIGALTKAELRVQRDKEENEEYSSKRNQMRPSVVKQDNEDDDWD